LAGELILVIEDNERNRKLASDVLEFAGMRVISAGTAADGVASAQQHAPDLVLMDIGLPDVDGVAALGQLRADPRTARIPVVAVTAYAMSGDRQSILDRGFDGYIPKPIDVKSFPEQVLRHLVRSRERIVPEPGEVTVLVVDDTPANARLLAGMLEPRGYRVLTAECGADALKLVVREHPHLVLLDVQMPDIDGYEVCRRIRSDPEAAALPVVMVTASVGHERLQALEAGADDFVTKPFNQAELLARIRSLVKVGEYQERIQAQASELAQLNRTLQERVDAQLEEMERLRRLQRFVSPQVAEAIMSRSSGDPLAFHRAEIAVLFSDLRGFTAFTGNTEPEESAHVMEQYHALVGDLVTEFNATVGHFAGDGIMLFFNDPVPCAEPALVAVRMALAIRDRMTDLIERWRKRGHELGCGIGIAFGYATVGEMGFEGRRDYGAIGSVCNLASRLSDEAHDGQILVGQRVYASVEGAVDAEPVGLLMLKGFPAPVDAWSILGPKDAKDAAKDADGRD
jgi:CheY-like chemotaxis protein